MLEIKSTRSRILTILIFVAFSVASVATVPVANVPVTGPGKISSLSIRHVDTDKIALPKFDEFIAAVENGNTNQIVGVYVPDVLALRVLQQPDNDSAYVSPVNGVATQFQDADHSGTIGLIAHNYLSGKLFFNLEKGQEVRIVYGDGRVERFSINRFYRYQATDPDSPHSNFIDLETDERLSSTQLYQRVYVGRDHVTFQTCIAKEDNLSWGRLFVIAEPETQTTSATSTAQLARVALLLDQAVDQVDQ